MEGVLPNNIAKLRKERRLSQEALAEKAGTTRNQLIKLEQGTRPLSSAWLERLGEALSVPPYLLIAPDGLLPNEDELAQMLAAAQETLPAGLPYSEWPRAVAAGLHMRLRMIAGDRATVDV